MLAFLSLAGAQAASFDCAKAVGKVEKLVCADAEVSELDSKLAKAYEAVLAKLDAEGRNSLLTEQRRWLQQSRNRCQKTTCVKHAYWERLVRLETYFRAREPELGEAERQKAVQALLNPGSFAVATGPGTQACGAILEDLKHMRDVRFVPPTAVAQTVEEISSGEWGKQCGGYPPMNYGWSCGGSIVAADGDDEVGACQTYYGLSPFRLYEIPVKGKNSPVKFLYFRRNYGPMNYGPLPPALGVGGGFIQIDERQCVTARGNQWNARGKEIKWRPTYVQILAPDPKLGQPDLNSVIEHKGQYYFLTFGFHNTLYVNLDTVQRSNFTCVWEKK